MRHAVALHFRFHIAGHFNRLWAVTHDERACTACLFRDSRSKLWRAFLLTGFLLFVFETCGLPLRAQSATNDLAAQEKEGCIKNLKTIYQAIEAYQLDHKDLPNWLSDLVPNYLPDANVLICPLCRRTGATETGVLADPKLPSSYLFEFCPLYVDTGNPNGPIHTRREWKRRQMGLVGSMVPIVRCRHHNPVLNVAFDGHIYESPGSWEELFTNRLDINELKAPQLFAGEMAPRTRPASRFPARDSKAGPGLLDLTRYYNVTLSEAWLGKASPTLAALSAGLKTIGGVEFDARGIMQVGSQSLVDKKFPRQVRGIGVHRKCNHLHFLQAVCRATPTDGSEQVASYFVHFADNPARLEIPVYYERDVGDYVPLPEEPAAANELTAAWTGSSSSTNSPQRIRLFTTTWTNLAPDARIESLDFVSSMAGPAPFVVAITAD